MENTSQPLAAVSLWGRLQESLRRRLTHEVYDLWFAPVRADEREAGKLLLIADNEFNAIWLQDNYADLIAQLAVEAAGEPVEVSILTRPSEAGPNGRAPAAAEPAEERRGGRGAGVSSEAPRARPSAFNDRYTFENFIVGSSNQLAHAACVAVAQKPGLAYNPLFLYGETGLGKTHLMHAMAQSILQVKAGANVAYISCEKFTNEFMKAIQENSMAKFRRRYRDVDVLLIDDIHFLSGRERTQEEFFHTFNDLFESSRQICLSSDRPASEIAKLEARLVSRFQWGMVADIQPPDLETRTAILAKKSAALNYQIPGEILQYLARRITRNVRRMEGALTRVGSYAQLLSKPIDVSTVERLLHDILIDEGLHEVTVERIQKAVVEYFGLRIADMTSKRRPNNIAFPRQIAMYLSRILTQHSLQEIGDAFGGRDHGTVIHACKQVENIMEQDESVRRAVDYLTKGLQNAKG